MQMWQAHGMALVWMLSRVVCNTTWRCNTRGETNQYFTRSDVSLSEKINSLCWKVCHNYNLFTWHLNKPHFISFDVNHKERGFSLNIAVWNQQMMSVVNFTPWLINKLYAVLPQIPLSGFCWHLVAQHQEFIVKLVSKARAEGWTTFLKALRYYWRFVERILK